MKHEYINPEELHYQEISGVTNHLEAARYRNNMLSVDIVQEMSDIIPFWDTDPKSNQYTQQMNLEQRQALNLYLGSSPMTSADKGWLFKEREIKVHYKRMLQWSQDYQSLLDKYPTLDKEIVGRIMSGRNPKIKDVLRHYQINDLYKVIYPTDAFVDLVTTVQGVRPKARRIKLPYRLELNPEIDQQNFVFGALMDYAQKESLSVAGCNLNRQNELRQHTYNINNSLWHYHNQGFRTGGIIFLAHNVKDLHSLTEQALMIYSNNQHHFQDRQNTKFLTPLVPGIAIGENYDIINKGTRSHARVIQNTLSNFYYSTQNDNLENSPDSFIEVLKYTASKLDIDSTNLAFTSHPDAV